MGTESETASSARRERILGRLQETAMAFVVADESIPHVAIGSVTVHLAGGRTDGFAWLTCEPDDYMPRTSRRRGLRVCNLPLIRTCARHHRPCEHILARAKPQKGNDLHPLLLFSLKILLLAGKLSGESHALASGPLTLLFRRRK